MTIGVYALYWEDPDLVYVGKSQNIESAFKARHCRKAELNLHSNYKVQEAYNLYGKPLLIILDVCPVSELDILEIFWTKELNSLHSANG